MVSEKPDAAQSYSHLGGWGGRTMRQRRRKSRVKPDHQSKQGPFTAAGTRKQPNAH